MLKRPSVLPKSQKTTFYAVFTFVSDVSTFLLVKSGKTTLHGRFRSRPSPPPLCSRSRSEAGGCLLPLISALAQAPPPPGRLLPLRDAHAASSRSPPSSTTPLLRRRGRSHRGNTTSSPANGAHPGANCRKPRRPALAPAPVQMASSGDVGRANASAESSHRWEIE
ncbi:hypothetical protein PVAP13_3KG120227 [Panicum virgatum]|uniref:Uncharacterized protein n=1 Tax=Panicum virgatum TaxID=38727 RepID=A0A8T0UTP9_PANVG|nr:hypothetical protein PVAP13_3KG120227 [Panicum virgatum]